MANYKEKKGKNVRKSDYKEKKGVSIGGKVAKGAKEIIESKRKMYPKATNKYEMGK